MPSFGGNRTAYRDTRTLPWNSPTLVMTPADQYSGTIVADPVTDAASIGLDGPYTSPGSNADPGLAVLRYERERQPTTFRTAPGPGVGFFSPAGG